MAVSKSTRKPTKKRQSRASRSNKARATAAAKRGKKKPTPKKPSAKAETPKDKCFVISPFGDWHDDYYTEIFCPAIKSAGLEPARADDLFRSSNIVHDIWHLVVTARVLLADLTGKNPNVFYELGLAHAARKPVLLLTQSMEDVPFDLRALRVVAYDVKHPNWGELLREKIKQGLKETLDSPARSVLPTFLQEEAERSPEVSEEEARFIEMQQQLDSLRAELRATGGGPDIRPPEARRMVEQMLDMGTPRGVIVRRVSKLGAPATWVEDEVNRQLADR